MSTTARSAAVTILPMPAAFERDVRALYAACHPGWKPVSPSWFHANPTLIAIHQRGIVGYTSYTMNVDPHGYAMYLQDTCVALSARRLGIASQLMERRLEIAREMKAGRAYAMTQPDNVAMLALLEQFGFRHITTIPEAYTQATPPEDGMLFVLDL